MKTKNKIPRATSKMKTPNSDTKTNTLVIKIGLKLIL